MMNICTFHNSKSISSYYHEFWLPFLAKFQGPSVVHAGTLEHLP